MPEGSSILRETGFHLKNQLPHCIRLRVDDFSHQDACSLNFARREIFS